MTFREQKKYIEILKKYEKKFDSVEKDLFKMFLKRHKDDEDLDKQSAEKLLELHEKYHVNKPKKSFDHFFKSPSENGDSH